MRKTKYEVLQKVIELGSLSKAADYCNYSQSAISQIVLSIESDLGLTLLNRSHTGVSLTSDGEQMLPYIRDIGAAYSRLSDKAFEILGIESGYIRIGTFSSISCHLLPPVIKQFKAHYPNIQLELLQGDYARIEKWIYEGVVDFGFVDLPARKEFAVTPILSDRMLALLPVGHPMAVADLIPLELFSEEPVVLLPEKKHKAGLDAFRQNKIKPRVEYRAEDDYTVMAMVEAGLGISILPELVLERTSYRIVTKETSPAFRRNIAIATRNDTQASMATKKFIEFIADSIIKQKGDHDEQKSG